jgi:hypothetical protein
MLQTQILIQICKIYPNKLKILLANPGVGTPIV